MLSGMPEREQTRTAANRSERSKEGMEAAMRWIVLAQLVGVAAMAVLALKFPQAVSRPLLVMTLVFGVAWAALELWLHRRRDK